MTISETLNLILTLISIGGILLIATLGWVILTERRLSKVETKVNMLVLANPGCPFKDAQNPKQKK